MIPSTVELKQIPDAQAESNGLAKYNRSRMPRTFDKLGPAIGEDGRYLTGLDEDCFSIAMIEDVEKREELRSNIKALRESLERQTSLDLGPFSPFWEQYYVDLNADTSRVFNKSNPKDVIAYHVLIANCYAAPNEELAGDPKYQHAKYFMYTREQEQRKNITSRKLKDKAKAALYNMSEDSERLLLLGKYLYGKKFITGMGADVMYDLFSDYLDSDKDKDVERFLKALKIDITEMQFKVTIDTAIAKRIIKYVDGYYQRGQVTLGKSLEQVYQNLMLPEFSTELMSIQEELK